VLEIRDYCHEQGDAAWERVVQSAWLTGQLVTIGHHIPKDYPKSIDKLLGRAEPAPKPATAQQWAALLSQMSGAPVKMAEPTL